MRVFVLLKLKPGVERADYEQWARAADLPGVRILPSVTAYDIWACDGLFGTREPAPYDYIETIDVTAADELLADAQTPAVQALSAKLAEYADATFIVAQRLPESA